MTYKDLMAAYVRPIPPVVTGLTPSGTIRKRPAAILFDIYGTLFVSASGDISHAKKGGSPNRQLAALVRKYRLPFTPPELVKGLFKTIKQTHEAMKNKGVDFPEVQIDRIWMKLLQISDIQTARRFAVEYEMIVNPVYPMPNLTRMIEGLKNRGITLGIISNAQFFTPLLFELFCGGSPEQLGFNPDLVFYSYQHGHAKPSPLLFEMAAERLQQIGLLPEEVLYVGNDMRNDIYPAHTVGFQTCLFAGDMRSLRLREDDPACASLTPDLVVTDLIQLLEVVKGLQSNT